MVGAWEQRQHWETGNIRKHLFLFLGNGETREQVSPCRVSYILCQIFHTFKSDIALYSYVH